MSTDFFPELSSSLQVLFRQVYGLLLLGTVLYMVPNWRRFLLSEVWGGYIESSPGRDQVFHPRIIPGFLFFWLVDIVAMTLGWAPVLTAFLNFLVCYQLFIRMRWTSLLRGMGAPGFMCFWLGAAVLLLEYTSKYATDLRPLALLVLQVDFATIMLTAGVSKVATGYVRNHGMELGLVNPMWGYWWKAYRSLSPDHWLIKGLNHLAWSLEVIAALLMVIPATRFWGGFLIFFSFFFVSTQIRLGFLAPMVMLACILYIPPEISSFLGFSAKQNLPSPLPDTYLNFVLAGFLWLIWCLDRSF